jgi:ABC-2 type transport system ATP-binding protein
LHEITKKFGAITAVNSISFTLRPGEILGYLGPNAAGKTTSIKMLAGLLQPTRGEILFEGQSVRSNLDEYKNRLGYVPEQSELYPHLSGLDYLLLVGRLRGIPEKVLFSKALDFIQVFGLENDEDASISTYSKGMRQKILISAALLHNPDILLLDEPLSGLDVTTALIVRDLIHLLAKEGKTVLFSSHTLEVAESMCSRVIILNRGNIVADDSIANLQNLMNLPSLTDIFSQLIQHENTIAIAARIVEIVKGHS